MLVIFYRSLVVFSKLMYVTVAQCFFVIVNVWSSSELHVLIIWIKYMILCSLFVNWYI